MPSLTAGFASADLAGAAARDTAAHIRNAETMAPEHLDSIRRGAADITRQTNADYDYFLQSILNDTD
jgi:hypothetical protein